MSAELRFHHFLSCQVFLCSISHLAGSAKPCSSRTHWGLGGAQGVTAQPQVLGRGWRSMPASCSQGFLRGSRSQSSGFSAESEERRVPFLPGWNLRVEVEAALSRDIKLPPWMSCDPQSWNPRSLRAPKAVFGHSDLPNAGPLRSKGPTLPGGGERRWLFASHRGGASAGHCVPC